jgi:anti-sigma-K factor RskA
LANGRATLRAGAEEDRVEACAAKQLAWSSSAWRVERVAIGVIVVELIGAAILFVRWRGRQRR